MLCQRAGRKNTSIATGGGRPAAEFLLIPFGRVAAGHAGGGGGFTFSCVHAQQAVAWFRSLGRRLVIDYEHQSIPEFNTRPDGRAPAAGWIGGLETRHDGLWATRVEWTPEATRLIAAREYVYFSPVIYWSDRTQQRRVESLGPVALTNEPTVKRLPALVACGRRVPWIAGAGDPPQGPRAARKENVMNGLRQTLGMAGRATVIAAAKKTFAAEVARGAPVRCAEADWVHAALRAAGQDQLTNKEIAQYGIRRGSGTTVLASRGPRAAGRSAPASPNAATGPTDRAALIADARASYAAQVASGEELCCSEKAAVHTALRDAGQDPLTDAEITQYGIRRR
jgi:hypothetical protein